VAKDWPFIATEAFQMSCYGPNGAQNPSSATSDNAAYVR